MIGGERAESVTTSGGFSQSTFPSLPAIKRMRFGEIPSAAKAKRNKLDHKSREGHGAFWPTGELLSSSTKTLNTYLWLVETFLVPKSGVFAL